MWAFASSITACVVAIRAVRHRSCSEFLVGGIAAAGPVLILSGWWFVRNLVLYGDLTGLNVFIEILGQRDVPADLAQLWRERYSFAAGYWGNFGGLNVPMPSWVYHALNALVVCAVLGLLRLLVRWLIKDRGRWSPGLWPLVLCLLWGVGVVVPWSQWAAVTWSSQGRLIFPALPVWSALLVLGLTSWAPTTWRGWVTALLSAALLSLAVVAPFAWIRPV